MRAFHIVTSIGVGFLACGISLAGGCAAGGDTLLGVGGAGGGAGSTGGHSASSASNAASSNAASSTAAATTGSGGGFIGCTPTNGVVLATSKLYLGDTDFNDAPNVTNGWKQYGFNIDGLVSTATSTNLCQPYMGAPKANVYPDGNNGIDNSFGVNILPMLASLQPGFSDSVNAGITNGTFTIMFKLEDLMGGADQSPLVGKVYGGGDLGAQPFFDGTDCWPVAPELLTNPADIETPKIVFPNGSLAGNVWQSGVAASVTLTIPTPVGTVTLTIHKAQLSMTLSPDHKAVTYGIIGGVLDREEFLKEVKKIIGATKPVFCSTFDTQIRQAADIMNDGTQDPTKVCNGISIGLGFKAHVVQLGGISPPTAPSANTCP
jgi:hypothetical protein